MKKLLVVLLLAALFCMIFAGCNVSLSKYGLDNSGYNEEDINPDNSKDDWDNQWEQYEMDKYKEYAY